MMISSFAHQLNELEQKIQGQNDTVNKIYRCLLNHVEESKNGEKSITPRYALDNVQAKVKENCFRINDLGSKVKRCEEELKDVKHTFPPRDGQWQDYSGQSQPHVSSPSPDSTTAPSPADWQYLKSNTPFAEPGTPVRGSGTCFYPLNTSTDPGHNWQFQGLTWSCAGTEPQAVNQMDRSALIAELQFYKNRTKDLEQELKKRDEQLNEMSARQMKMGPGQQNDNWVEHKLKLLKQDKRRRGETIGKLLKCIDDMRDSGRLDPSKVTEGRAVLSATLASQGLPIEERVRRTVKAVEFDRVPRVPRSDQPENNEDAIAEENKNNSARRASLLSIGSSSSGGSSSSLPTFDHYHNVVQDEADEHCGKSSASRISDDEDSEEELETPAVLHDHHMSDEEIGHVVRSIASEYGFRFNSCI